MRWQGNAGRIAHGATGPPSVLPKASAPSDGVAAPARASPRTPAPIDGAIGLVIAAYSPSHPQRRAENGPGGHLDVFFEEEWAVDAEGEVAGAWDFLSARADVNEQGLEAGEDGEPWYQELREVWVIVFESGGEEGIYSLKTQAAAEGGEAGAEGEVDVDVVVAFEGQDDAARVASLLEGYMPFEPLVVGQR